MQHGKAEPIFIGGMYKSGTSLLRAMLGRHSRLFAGLETQWLYESWTDVGAERRRWVDRLSTFFQATPDDLERACHGANDVESSLDAIMRVLADRAGKARWIEKTPGNAGVIGRILAHWQDSRVVQIIRDPRDVYASFVEADKGTDPEDFATRWTGTVAAARGWLAGEGGAHPAYYELRYENLVRTPEEEIRKLLTFLGEAWEPQLADFPGQPEDFERVRQATGVESSTLRRLARPLTTDRVGLWAETVPEAQWRAVRSALDACGVLPLVDAMIAETDALFLEEAGGGR